MKFLIANVEFSGDVHCLLEHYVIFIFLDASSDLVLYVNLKLKLLVFRFLK